MKADISKRLFFINGSNIKRLADIGDFKHFPLLLPSKHVLHDIYLKKQEYEGKSNNDC